VLRLNNGLVNIKVKYGLLSFDKPLGAYYIDDKGITPELFWKPI